MTLILLFDDDFAGEGRVRLTGRRLEHVRAVHRAVVGEELTVGVANGRIGQGRVVRIDDEALELDIVLDRDPPPPVPLTLILAVPRPKVLNRVIAGATSLGVKRIVLINAWRVEKSYWSSPRMTPENLRMQSVLGLEQACDTVLPVIELHRLFRPFIEQESFEGIQLAAHPVASRECPRAVKERVTLAVGPEGGFIGQEIESLQRAGFELVSLGQRVLRVETAVPALIARLF